MKTSRFRKAHAGTAAILAAVEAEGPRRGLALDLTREGGDLAQAVLDAWPGQRVDDPHQAPEARFDLIVACDGTDAGGLAETFAAISHVRDRLSLGGLLLLGVPALGAPDPGSQTDFDALLFPHLAAAGHLGDDPAARTPLGAAAWRMLANAVGLEVIATWGEGEQTLPTDLVERHEARLSVFDAAELRSGLLTMLLRRPGASA